MMKLYCGGSFKHEQWEKVKEWSTSPLPLLPQKNY
jgi:hypothetical protein